MSTSLSVHPASAEHRQPLPDARALASRFGAWALGAVAALCLPPAAGLTPARAEIAPEYYARDQAGAPERVTLKVRDVEASACPMDLCDHQDLIATAEVTEVIRSATGLKPGAVITLKWRRKVPKAGWAGPRPLRALVAGESVPAWLRKSDAEHYAPAARGYSFGPDRSSALRPRPDAPATPPAPVASPSAPADPSAPPGAPAAATVPASAPATAP